MANELEHHIERHWTSTSGTYNRWSRNHLANPIIVRVWRDVLEKALRGETSNVLDVGTGPGTLALIMKQFCERVTGVDIASGMLEQARANAQWLGASVEFRQGDAENLPFPDQFFSGLTNRIVLWTLPHPEQALVEWKRVLRPSGRIVIIDTNGVKIRRTLRHKLWKLASVPLTLATECRNPLKGRQPMSVWEQLPLTKVLRPHWDVGMLARLGFREIETSIVSRSSFGVLEYLKHGCWGDYFVVTATRGE